ncbi:MAG TPA: lysophospholipid acyltransferase family protein [Terriglobales bacterium]|nr:lysophospholipid acyltransferase family protein [Terriglobales bacterium]
MRQRLQYALAWILIKLIGALPRPLARAAGIALAGSVYLLHRRLRQVGGINLKLAFPEKNRRQRARILRGVFVSFGRQAAEVCLLPKYTRENVHQVVVYDGFQNFECAFKRGKGVLFLTAHLGGWELSAFVHSLHGHPLHVVMRPLDNIPLDRLVRRYRTMHGNTMVEKDDFVRGLLAAIKAGETVGILMDTNMTPPQGVFVDFFGIPACTASGLARIALRTDAAVVPGFTIWDSTLGKYRLRFDPPVPLIRTGDDDADAVANTARFTSIIEGYVRRYPEQWLWVHRRWKTRPEGQPPFYQLA